VCGARDDELANIHPRPPEPKPAAWSAEPGLDPPVSANGNAGPPAARAAAPAAADGVGVASRNATAAAYAAPIREPQYTAAEQAANDLLVQRVLAGGPDPLDTKAATWKQDTSFTCAGPIDFDALAASLGPGYTCPYGRRMPARSSQPLAGRAAPGGGAGSRDVPMPGGARPPRLAAGRLHHAPPAPGIARGAAHMLRLCVSHVKAGRHLLSVPYSKCFKSATGCCLRPPGWQAAGLVCSCRARYRPAALERVHAWLCLRPL